MLTSTIQSTRTARMCAVRNWLGPSTARLCRVRNESSLRDGPNRSGTSTKETRGGFTAVQ